METFDIVLLIIIALIITVFYIGLGNQRKNVHGCTGGGLTVEKSTKESD